MGIYARVTGKYARVIETYARIMGIYARRLEMYVWEIGIYAQLIITYTHQSNMCTLNEFSNTPKGESKLSRNKHQSEEQF
jgi:hypothetical protein